MTTSGGGPNGSSLLQKANEAYEDVIASGGSLFEALQAWLAVMSDGLFGN